MKQHEGGRLEIVFEERIEQVEQGGMSELEWRRHTQEIRGALPHMRKCARDARKRAETEKSHYGGYYVGAGLLAYKDGEYRLFMGWNYLPAKGHPSKRCAEKHALEQAREKGYTPLAIVVVGAQKVDDATGINGPTLRPCAICRTLLEGYQGTLLCLEDPDSGAAEVHTVPSLHRVFNHQASA